MFLGLRQKKDREGSAKLIDSKSLFVLIFFKIYLQDISSHTMIGKAEKTSPR